MNPLLFEAYVAALYTKQGFQTYLTPSSNDKGVDVVALSSGRNLLIQAKQTTSKVGIEAVQEICAAKRYYEGKFSERFELAILSNSDFWPSAEVLAVANQIELIRRQDLMEMMSENDVTIQEVNRHEFQRLTKV